MSFYFYFRGLIKYEIMNILILGSGGREDAFAWKITQSPLCKNLFIAPGNAGTKAYGVNVSLDILNNEAVGVFCIENKIDCILVGPEAPLVNGIYDYFKTNDTLSSIFVIGPSYRGAMLEGSKQYAKEFMIKHEVPTAIYRKFTSDNIGEGIEYLSTQSPPIVLKADGLAAGKGVVIALSVEEAVTEFKEMLGGKFGAAGNTVVVEEFMKGIEFSVFVLTDGENYKILPVAKDYKRIGEGDTGLNTGGMGAVSPPSFVTKSLMQVVEKDIVIPSINGLKKDGIEYVGFLYIGLMLTEGNIPRVVEYNCRMGDPETQAVIPRIKSDFVGVIEAMRLKKLNNFPFEIDSKSATTIVIAANGYPGDYVKGEPIELPSDLGNDVVIFHAGTTNNEKGEIVSNGGRVLAVTAISEDWQEAVKKAIATSDTINYKGKYFRRDIGMDLL